MIRFSCPGCGATYSVDDSKGGKTGKCPKCTAHFQIPMPEAGAAPSPPPPPPPSNFPAPPPSSTPGDVGQSTVEINPCPGCEARLSVNGSDIGIDVECPYCKTVYKATRAGTRPSSTVIPPPPMKIADEENERPSRRSSRNDDDEDDRPSRRSKRGDDDDEDARPSRRSRRDEDDEEEDRPRKRRKKRRRRSSYDDDDRRGGGEAHRGVLILILGFLGFCCCFFSIAALIMGMQDLNKMQNGEMDSSGKGLTIAGMIVGGLMLLLNVGGAFMNRGGGGP